MWAKDAILNLYQKKIISGKENGRFAPQDNLSREEAVKILVGTFGLFEKQEDLHFSDCNVEDWYYPYVSIAVKSGIVRGISETLFGTRNKYQPAGFCGDAQQNTYSRRL